MGNVFRRQVHQVVAGGSEVPGLMDIGTKDARYGQGEALGQVDYGFLCEKEFKSNFHINQFVSFEGIELKVERIEDDFTGLVRIVFFPRSAI